MHPILVRIPLPGWKFLGELSSIPIHSYGVMLGLSRAANRAHPSPARVSCLDDMRPADPIVAAVATDEPEIAENTPQAAMLLPSHTPPVARHPIVRLTARPIV